MENTTSEDLEENLLETADTILHRKIATIQLWARDELANTVQLLEEKAKSVLAQEPHLRLRVQQEIYDLYIGKKVWITETVEKQKRRAYDQHASLVQSILEYCHKQEEALPD